jgi:uncharacterized membrane protein YeaQ/YmgE (transglycosylase-associated protein family)
MEIAALVAVLVSGFVIGLLARLAVPGPDPMPIWKTLLFGVAGSFIGGGVGYGIAAEWGAFMGSVIAATILVLVYRRFVQKRPITGPGAKLRPGR